MTRRWYVVNTKPKNEDRAAVNLESGQFEVFNPKLKVRKFREGKYVPFIEPMFPGYIFVKFDFQNDFHTIKYTRGIKTIVHFGNKVVPINDELITFIGANLVSGVGEIKKKAIQKGERVLVREGPFKGLSGIFEKELDGRERVAILLEGMNFAARMEIDKEYVVGTD